MISVLEKLIIDDRRATGKQEQYQICYAVLFQNVANSVGGTGRMLTEAKHSNLFCFFKKKGTKGQRQCSSEAQVSGSRYSPCYAGFLHKVSAMGTLEWTHKSNFS